MMRRIFFVSIAVLALCGPAAAAAQNAGDDTARNGSGVSVEQVAQVDMYDARIAHYNGVTETYTLTFTFAAGDRVQPDVYYGIELWSRETGEVVHRKRFEPVVLTAGEQRQVSVTYTPPRSLDGAYRMVLVSETGSGLRLAQAPVGSDVELERTAPYIEIDEDTCVTHSGGTFPSGSSFVFTPATPTTISCEVVNRSTTTRSVTARATTYRGSSLTQPLVTQESENGVEVAPGERAELTASFTSPERAGPYRTYVAAYEGDTRRSNSAGISYRVAGTYGTIDNVTFDKALYRRGDMADISLLWSGVRQDDTTATATEPLSGAQIRLALSGRDGEQCSEPVTIDADRSVVSARLSVRTLCVHPKLTATLTADGVQLDTKTYQITSSTTPTAGLSANMKRLLIVFGVVAVVVLGAAGVWLFRKRRGDGADNDEPSTPRSSGALLILVAGVVTGVCIFAGPSVADAGTWMVRAESETLGDYGSVTTNLNNSSFEPGDTMQQTVTVNKPRVPERYNLFGLWARWLYNAGRPFNWKPTDARRLVDSDTTCRDVGSCATYLYEPLNRGATNSYLGSRLSRSETMKLAEISGWRRMSTRREWTTTTYPWADWTVSRTVPDFVTGEYTRAYTILDLMAYRPYHLTQKRLNHPIYIAYRVNASEPEPPEPTASLVGDTDSDPNNGTAGDEMTILRGETAYLHWESSNADSCTSDDFETNGVVEGTQDVAPTEDTAYDVSCDGATDTVTVNVEIPDPSVTLLADDDDRLNEGGDTTPASDTSFTITAGETAYLHWQSNSDVASCSSEDFSVSGNEPSGSTSVTPASDTTYTVTCDAPDGTQASDDVTVVVDEGSAPSVMLTGERLDGSGGSSDSLKIETGDEARLIWETQNVSSCSASGDWSGPKDTGTHSQEYGPYTIARSYTYTLECSQPSSGLSDSDSFTVVVEEPTGSTPPPGGGLSCEAVGPDGATDTVAVGSTVIWRVNAPEFSADKYTWYNIDGVPQIHEQPGTSFSFVHETVGDKSARVEVDGETVHCTADIEIVINPDFGEF